MIKTYDPGKFVIAFKGVPLVGYGENFFKLTQDEDAFMKKVGASGEVARARNQNRTGKVEVTLMQTSLSNDYLSTMFRLDKDLGLGAGTLTVADLSGTTIVSIEDAWISKLPDLEFGKELAERTWTFDTGQIVIFNVGGNV